MRTYKSAGRLALILPTTLVIVGAQVDELFQALRRPCVIQVELCAEDRGRPLHLPDQFGSLVWMSSS